MEEFEYLINSGITFAQAFAGAMKKAYPDLPGADGLEDLAKALYK